MIADIHHVTLNVSDLDRSVAFYRDALGMDLLERPELPVEGVWLDAGNGRQIHLVRAEVPSDCGQHVAFRVVDLRAAIGELRAAGVRVSLPTSVGAAGIVQAFASDPDGNRLEFTQTSR